jgi:hypothetical protein
MNGTSLLVILDTSSSHKSTAVLHTLKNLFVFHKLDILYMHKLGRTYACMYV